jgi:heat shock protein HslJ
MKIIISSLILIIMGCNATKKSSEMQDFPSGNYEIVEFNAENFEAQKTYNIKINAEEQRIAGKFDCNNYSSEYEKDGKNIDFGFAIASKMYCEGEMENEKAFFGELSKMKSFEYEDGVLKFFDDSEKMILKLKKQDS